AALGACGGVERRRRPVRLRLLEVADRTVLAEVDGAPEPVDRAVVDVGVEGVLPEALGGERPRPRPSGPGGREQPPRREQPAPGLQAGVGRLHAAPHVLHGQKPAAYHDVRLAPAGRARRPGVVVAVLSRPDDWAVTHTAGDLPGEAAGRGHGGEVALRRDGVA